MTVPANVVALPFIDEHAIDIDVEPGVVWDAARRKADRAVGFRTVAAERPGLLVLAGRHPFARYAIVLRIEEATGGARCRLESRADFPGLHGRLYRLAVVGTGLHVLAVERLLRSLRRDAL